MLSTFLHSINIYQRFISPYKGFSCAHRVLHGDVSCSSYIKTIIQENGYWRGRSAIRDKACSNAAKALRSPVAVAQYTQQGDAETDRNERRKRSSERNSSTTPFRSIT